MDPRSEASDVGELLRAQWAALRGWLKQHDVLRRGEEPSRLGTWTIQELVVHLGYGIRMLADVTAAPAEDPIDIADYIAGYHPAHRQIADDTQIAAISARGDELRTIDRMAAEAWETLDMGLPAVVRGRRGPLLVADFITTRLIELVAHGDDLHRALDDATPSPLLTDAITEVVAAFSSAYKRRSGHAPRELQVAADAEARITFVRRATGRIATDDPWMPLLS